MAMMTTEHDFGKDHVVFMSEQEAESKPNYQLPPKKPEDEPSGAILPNGEINWDCPCLGGMASGPCALQFQDAFSCFHYSEEEPKGRECIEQFHAMQSCLEKFPNLYPAPDDSEKTLEKSAGANDDDTNDAASMPSSVDNDDQKEKFVAAAAASQAKQQKKQNQ
ncbi:mitochondrial intermembrane space import and assembly protein 40-A-like [Tropilaelaps mercedesae]|uniref:Mitochondrial intermembrane space import and assembly protein 40-A-like n=1 Tax=Tropilaelaps mercedesae TaxID=418985 RepID=A0A1V9Y072_9ACAR|nr:mitochondrial intermembrane space import and assembly protein 40-A-like [Tropilaelaps mercedesae]